MMYFRWCEMSFPAGTVISWSLDIRWAVGILAVLAALTSWFGVRVLGVPVRFARRVTFLSPIILIICYLLIVPYGSPLRHEDELLAGYVYLAAGFGFSISSIRMKRRPFVITGIIFLLINLIFIILNLIIIRDLFVATNIGWRR